jgi:cysteine-rich repeat protein
MLVTCGNGITDDDIAGEGIENEECDDGNTINTDGCTNLCKLPTCGDGIVQPSLDEDCDDGNSDNTDSCTNDCLWNDCGDGVRYITVSDEGNPNDVEECDGGDDIASGDDAWDDGGSAGICNGQCQVQCFGGVNGRDWAGVAPDGNSCIFVAEQHGDDSPGTFNDIQRNFTQAQSHCEGFGVGANLVKIPDAETDAFVHSLRLAAGAGDIWMGLEDLSFETSVIDPPGDWYWVVDGSAASYTNWANNEPNNQSQDCGQIFNNGFWDDLGCTSNRSFVCQFPL